MAQENEQKNISFEDVWGRRESANIISGKISTPLCLGFPSVCNNEKDNAHNLIHIMQANLVYRIAPQSRQMRCFRRLPSSPWRLKVTKASPCCQPSPISLEPQYWHRVIGICFIVSTPLSGVLQTHNTEEASGSLLKLSMQNGKKSLSNSEKATAFAVALPLLMICCPWFRDKVYVLSIIRISIAATCARVALP